MGTYRLLLVFLSLLASASAQQAPNDTFKVEGTVINSVTGKPLPRVLVQLSVRSVLTGPEGEFSFDGVAAGRASIMLMKPGYFGPGETPRSYNNAFDVGPDTGKIILKLAPEVVIAGHVTGQDEEPLEGASMQVLGFREIEGRQVLMPVRGDVRTDEDGNFRIAGLPSGRYYLAVRAGNLARRVLGAQTRKAPEAYPAIVYYPGTADLAAATALDLAPGQKVDTPFSISLSPAYKLAGKVVAAGEWKQINSPMIIDSLDQVLFTPEQFDAASGAFEFRAVPAGTYTIRVSGSDLQNHYRFSTHKVTVSGSVTNFHLSLQPGINIPVVERSEFNKPRERGSSCPWSDSNGELHQSDCSDYPGARVELISLDSVRLRFSSDWHPVKDPSDYAVNGVAPGKYMVRAQPSFGGYVQSLRSGNLDLLREVLTVPEEGSVAPIEVVLRDDPGTLKVIVHAEKPGQPATILVLPDGAFFPSPNLIGNTSTEVDFPPMAPGNYKVFAFDSLDGLDYGDPEALAKYASKAAAVTVTANGNASVIVNVIHNGE
ncbi:MAG TPA: carboxypeptidase-like regulatory domain-containing protein [Candidatus Angelobacter sp.]